MEVKGKLDGAVCAQQDWLEAIEAISKLKSHDKLKESLVDTGVHDALAKFLAHDISLAKHAKPEDHLGSQGSFMFGVTYLGFFCRSQPHHVRCQICVERESRHQSARRYKMKHGYDRNLNENTKVFGWRLCISHACFCFLFAFRMQLPQDPETMAARFVDDTSQWSKVLQFFFSSESEMQKLQKKTHSITS